MVMYVCTGAMIYNSGNSENPQYITFATFLRCWMVTFTLPRQIKWNLFEQLSNCRPQVIVLLAFVALKPHYLPKINHSSVYWNVLRPFCYITLPR
jgi:hypothetical protein